MTFNLTEEYGDLLDYIVDAIDNSEALTHYGVKGMRWGIRKNQERPALTGLGPSSVTVKTKNGSSITIDKDPPNAIARGMSKVSTRFTNYYNRGAFLTIKDGDGKKVGEATVSKKGDSELNLMWLQVNKSERGQGYATAAISAAIQFGKESGLEKLTLEVPGNAPDARHIYESQGFRVTKEPTVVDKADIWGGLTEMEYNFSEINHTGVGMSDSELAHYGVKGMKWGQRRAELSRKNENYDDNQRNRDKQVYGARGSRRINRNMNKGDSISTARSREKTRRDSVMGKNKYVRQVGKLAGGAAGAVIGNVALTAVGQAASSRVGRDIVTRIAGPSASVGLQVLAGSSMVRGAVTLGAANVGYMMTGDAAVAANMRLNGYNPDRK